MSNSHYLDHLNSVDGTENYQGVDEQKLQDDLSIFANTQFFNFDIGTSTDISQSVDDLLMQQEAHVQHVKKEMIDVRALDEFSVVGSSSPASSSSSTPLHQAGPSNPVFQGQPQQHRQRQSVGGPSSTPSLNSKSKLGTSSTTLSIRGGHEEDEVFDEGEQHTGTGTEGTARRAAEEDKRRRNTAASARFRIKKKLREQQMEQTARELQEKVTTLEMRIMQLEMENKWLKNLVVEKNEARDTSQLLNMKKKVLEASKQ